ncbi:hypothetical protein CW748_00890 [Alteromonadales bacterium alter-6D02]|nr:hypothetical protein CW748_00890 [Alteromonadales bacterium alter-6D02]
MQSIKKYTCISLISCTLILSGCQTAPVFDEQTNKVNVTKVKPTPPEEELIEPVVEEKTLSKAQHLFEQPNLYLVNNPPVADEIKDRFAQVVTLIKRDELTRAKTILEEMTLQSPMLSGLWLKLGDIARMKREQSLAQQHYSRAISLNSNNYFARNRLAAIYRQQGEFELSKEQYTKALMSWPGFVEGHRNLGILLDLYLGQKEQALEHYQIAQELLTLNNKKVDRKLKGWIRDLTRQLAKTEKVK